MSATDTSPNQKRAQTLFQTGNEAALKSNYDYAIDMYLNACKLVPDNLLYRQSLRGIERRKFGNDPAKVGFMAGAKVQPIHLKAKSAKAKKQWEHVLEICEEAFKINPWDVGAARSQAEAAEQLNLLPLAQWTLESVRGQAPKDVDYLRHMAHAYELNESWQRAIDCWEDVKKLVPTDDQARSKIQGLAANATIKRSGLGESVLRPDPKEEAKAAAQAELDELKGQVVPPEERLLRAIEADPAHVGLYLELADHYKLGNRLEEAEKILARGRKAVPDDEVMRAAHAEIQMSRLQRAVAHWTKQVKKNPDDPDARAKLDQFTKVLDDYELKEFRRRVEQSPNDASIRLQLGLRLARVGRHDEAIAEFQQARNSAPHKVQALQEAGKSFEAKSLHKLAERNYLEALKLAEAEGEEQSLVINLRYRLGLVCEAQGKGKEAEEHYNEVAALDYTYLDVAERLRALNESPAS